MAGIHAKASKQEQRRNGLKTWLESIRAAHAGLLRAVDIVEAARNPQSIGHRYLTWDDFQAAEKHRLIEAERLIRRVYVINATDGQRQPAYLSLLPDREKPGGGYRPTSEIVSSKALAPNWN